MNSTSDKDAVLQLVIGTDNKNNTCLCGMDDMLHLLVAGVSGSGKSTFLHATVLALIHNNFPEALKLLLIDPDGAEFSLYNGLPHLLMSVVTDSRKGIAALESVAVEITRRYKLFTENEVRDIAAFNKSHAEDILPYFIVVVDRLQSLLTAQRTETTNVIYHITQGGRAAGVYVIAAVSSLSAQITPREVVAAFPSRVCFRVSTRAESRLMIGKEEGCALSIPGEILFKPIGRASAQRLTAPYVDDRDIAVVVGEIKASRKAECDANFIQQVEEHTASPDACDTECDEDPMLKTAVEVVIDAGEATTSLLQRRCKLGYARAARIMDEMEQRGIIGPYEGAKPRVVLVSRRQWLEMNVQRFEAAAPDEDSFELSFSNVEDNVSSNTEEASTHSRKLSVFGRLGGIKDLFRHR